jgi:transcriptional regulator with XRE-family HTH domain
MGDLLRQFKGNRLALVIDKHVVDQSNPGLREAYKEKICASLKIKKNSYTMILNNTGQPSLAQLVLIAQILEVKLDDLVELVATEVAAA